MNEIKHRAIQKTVQGLNKNYQSHELLTLKQGMELPNRKAVINILRDLKEIIFPGYHGPGSRLGDFGDHTTPATAWTGCTTTCARCCAYRSSV